MNRLTRRRLLRIAAAGGLASVFGRLPEAVHAQMAGGHAAFDDYKALVCVFLFGGNDSWNMVVPRSPAEYAAYATARQNLAIPQGDLLALDAAFGLHPTMTGLRDLYLDGRCAIVANVGPLIVPTTRAQYESGTVALPPQLFSHNDQQDQWHSLKGRAQLRSGWAGRVADALAGATTSQVLALNVSLSGQTLFQAGEATLPYTMGSQGPVEYFGLGTSGFDAERRAAFERLLAATQPTVYGRAYAGVQQRSLASASTVTAALATAPALATTFPASPLGQQLATVARLIAVRDRLAMTRQVFFVATGGFDTHDAQNEDQPGLLGNVSASLQAFHDATVELGVDDRVTAFTQSDFGRTLTSNGDGTDHAWGGVQLVVGGAVAGGRQYGSYPVLQIGGPDDVGAGRLIPTTSSDQYAATLARWFGVPENQLTAVAPNLGNFSQRDLGFLI
jgi:uncharacterized protein (DUF1501 family)